MLSIVTSDLYLDSNWLLSETRLQMHPINKNDSQNCLGKSQARSWKLVFD